MKRHGYLYEKIKDKENLRQAILRAAKNKKDRSEVQKVLRNIPLHVNLLHEILTTKNYQPGRLTEKIIREGAQQKERHVTKIQFFPDQVIHWAIILVLQPLIMSSSYIYSCGSMPGRGPHRGKKVVERWIRKDRKNTKYCAKLDIIKFYPSLTNTFLKQVIRNHIKDPELLWLLDIIIDTHKQGAPIGYLTSQWLANLALQRLDYIIKQKVKIIHYMRYMDDMVLFGASKRTLHKAINKVREYLGVLGLKIKQSWQVFRIECRALDFMGFRFYRYKTTLRKSLMLRITRRVRKVYRRGKANFRDAAGIISYLGWFKHSQTYIVYKNYVKPYISIAWLKLLVSYCHRKELGRFEYINLNQHFKAA